MSQSEIMLIAAAIGVILAILFSDQDYEDQNFRLLVEVLKKQKVGNKTIAEIKEQEDLNGEKLDLILNKLNEK